MAHHAPHDHHSDGHAHGADDDLLAEMLDLDAEVFAPYLSTVLSEVADLAKDGVTHIVDLGAGTGTGTFALLERFPTARVTAVDSSAAMLTRLTENARARELDERVRTLEADASGGLPTDTGADVVWASASMHHLADPVAALAGIRAALRPGGLLAVLELDGIPRFLPGDAVPERPGLEDRCRDALSAINAEQVPHLSTDWGTLLTAAGFTVERERAERLELTDPPAGAGRYAYLALSRLRGAFEGRLHAADLAALDTLLDGGTGDVRHRDDLAVRTERKTWLARRP